MGPQRGHISDIVERIAAMSPGRSTIVVAVDGCGGAGKTELACALACALAEIGERTDVIHFDDFFLPSALRVKGPGSDKPIGADFDWERLRDQVLVPLRAGEVASYARYDWELDALGEARTVAPGCIVIVEGVYCSRRELAPLYDLRIWVDCPRHLRLRRGIERDGEASRVRWELDWMPAEDRYVEQHQPDEMADIVVSGTAASQ
jgi:uridine kinase